MRLVMKFSDIKKFTGVGNYHVSVGVRDVALDIEDYMSRHGLDISPDFQRAHVWTKAQSIAYVEYILRGGISGRNFYFNHEGWMRDFKGEFVLVDGKQRIKAITNFLNNKMPVFGHLYNEFEDQLYFSSNVVDFYINDLRSRKEVLTWYLELNSGGVVHTKKELDKVKRLLEMEE